MALVAYPGGLDQLRALPIWKDIVTSLLTRQLGRMPTVEEISDPGAEIERWAMEYVLREEHPKHARTLLGQHFTDSKGRDAGALLEHADLRHHYGDAIGRIAASHGLSIDEVRAEFEGHPLPPPDGYPDTWVVDLLKVACLLRVADACQLTGRAPRFLRILRKPSELSNNHWIFQQHLLQPLVASDRLVFRSGHRFHEDEAEAWWLCFDTLQMANRELQQVDAVFIDLRREQDRFVVHGIVGAESPDRLAKEIPTDHWMPVNTQVRITDVAGLVRTLGGEQLYGHVPLIPLRELIQNATDAIRARAADAGYGQERGAVCVRTGKDEEGEWVEVEDNGIGMSTAVLTDPLLDFGATFWGSPLMRQEFPGLLSKRFQPTGKFGVGFFSVFMWGDHVRVTTRPYKLGEGATQVLDFKHGLSSRPLLRQAHEKEVLIHGGTVVRIWTDKLLYETSQLVTQLNNHAHSTFAKVCGWLCPTLDVNLDVQVEGEARVQVVAADDWVSLDGNALIERLQLVGFTQYPDQPDNTVALGANMRLIRDETSGEVVGRACAYATGMGSRNPAGVVTVGGIRSSPLSNIVGVLMGDTDVVTRDVAIPIVHDLAEWASEQAALVRRVITHPARLNTCAALIDACGGDTGDLPVVITAQGWMSLKDIAEWDDAPDQVAVAYSLGLEQVGYSVRMSDKCFVASNAQAILWSTNGRSDPRVWAPHRLLDSDIWTEQGIRDKDRRTWSSNDQTRVYSNQSMSMTGHLVKALAKAWKIPLEDVLQASDFRGIVPLHGKLLLITFGISRVACDAVIRKPGVAIIDNEFALVLADSVDSNQATSLPQERQGTNEIGITRGSFVVSMR